MSKQYTSIKGTTSRITSSLMAIVIIVFTLFSCSKDSDNSLNGTSRLSISIGGIASEDVTTAKGKQMSSFANSFIEEENINIKNIKLNKGVELDFGSAVSEDLTFGGNNEGLNSINGQSDKVGRNLLAANTSSMAVGTKYWFVLYDPISQKYEHSLQIASGTKVELDVYKGQSYEWYAYSYNSEDNIAAFDPNNPEIQTVVNKPLLYAKGTVTATAVGSTPVVINFKHQLQQLKVQIDTRGLFGDIVEIKTKLAQNTDIKTSAFNIKSGTLTGSLTTDPIGQQDLVFTKVENDSERLLQVRLYSADLARRSYVLDLEKLSVKLLDGSSMDLDVSRISLQDRTFTFTLGGAGKIHLTSVKAYKTIPTKRILHIEGNSTYSYAASNPRKASGAFLRDARNFGPNSNYLRIESFAHEVQSSSSNLLRDKLANPADYPDIIIASMFTGFTTADYLALEKYIRRGGVVFLMIENHHGGIPQDFFRRLFNSQSVYTSEHDHGGTVYKLDNVDSDVLAWPFGDTRGKYWGQDGSQTLYLGGIPASEMNKLVVYTGSSVNRSSQYPGEISCFRHKEFNFFYVGDTGMLSNELVNGQYGSTTIEPFVTNSNNFPVAHTRYGTSSGSSAPEPNKSSWHVYNSIIFGNIFAHLIAQSEYKPLDKTP